MKKLYNVVRFSNLTTMNVIEELPVNTHTDTPMLPLPSEIFNSPQSEVGLNWDRLLSAARNLKDAELSTACLQLSGLSVNVILSKMQDRIVVELQDFVDDADIWDVLEDLNFVIGKANMKLPREIFILRSF